MGLVACLDSKAIQAHMASTWRSKFLRAHSSVSGLSTASDLNPSAEKGKTVSIIQMLLHQSTACFLGLRFQLEVSVMTNLSSCLLCEIRSIQGLLSNRNEDCGHAQFSLSDPTLSFKYKRMCPYAIVSFVLWYKNKSVYRSRTCRKVSRVFSLTGTYKLETCPRSL